MTDSTGHQLRCLRSANVQVTEIAEAAAHASAPDVKISCIVLKTCLLLDGLHRLSLRDRLNQSLHTLFLVHMFRIFLLCVPLKTTLKATVILRAKQNLSNSSGKLKVWYSHRQFDFSRPCGDILTYSVKDFWMIMKTAGFLLSDILDWSLLFSRAAEVVPFKVRKIIKDCFSYTVIHATIDLAQADRKIKSTETT